MLALHLLVKWSVFCCWAAANTAQAIKTYTKDDMAKLRLEMFCFCCILMKFIL